MAAAPKGAKSDNVSDLAADTAVPAPAAVSDMDAAPAAAATPDTVKSDNVSDLPGSRVCRVPVLHDGHLYAAGDFIPLTPKQAAALAPLGAIDPEV